MAMLFEFFALTWFIGLIWSVTKFIQSIGEARAQGREHREARAAATPAPARSH